MVGAGLEIDLIGALNVAPDQISSTIAGDVITVKDVAIGGNLEDLASARGQVGDARQLADLDFNMLTVPGFYRTTGNPKNGPIGISGASIGSLFVSGMQGNGNRLFQIMVSGNGIYWRTSISGGTTWEIWNQVLTGNKIGDGIRNTNGIISVPEMQGATASTVGTSGLVPPAAAGQQECFLTGGGEYKAALDFTPVQQGGGTGQDNTKIYIGSAGVSGLKAQQGTTDLGNIVTTTAGTTRAPSATKVYVENFGEMSWINTQYANSPANVWCLPADSDYAHLCSPSVLSVGSSQLTIASPNTRIFQTNGILPEGGSWVVIVSRDGNGVVAQLAGGSAVDTSGGVALAIRVQ